EGGRSESDGRDGAGDPTRTSDVVQHPAGGTGEVVEAELLPVPGQVPRTVRPAGRGRAASLLAVDRGRRWRGDGPGLALSDDVRTRGGSLAVATLRHERPGLLGRGDGLAPLDVLGE